MGKSPEEMVESMISNLEAKTGRKLSEWISIAGATGAKKHGEIVKFLKQQHALGHGYANLVAMRALEAESGGAASEEDLVAAQYAGPRAGLNPVHDAIVAAAQKLGSDVEVSPKKTCVSLRRARQFALVQPASNTRVDLGLKLDGVPFGGRLEKWPSTMCTHRLRLESAEQVDSEVRALLKKAYEQAK